MSQQYRVEGVDKPLRLSAEHAEKIGAQLWPHVRRPKGGATKAEWIAFVVEHFDVSQAVAEAMTVSDLKGYKA